MKDDKIILLKFKKGLGEVWHMSPNNIAVPLFVGLAIGTFVGALITALTAVSFRMYLAIGVGFCFLIGGIMMVLMLPSPLWFNIIDLSLAYLPMGWLGWKIGSKIK